HLCLLLIYHIYLINRNIILMYFLPPSILLLTIYLTSFLNRCTFFRYNVFNQIEVVDCLLEALSSLKRLAPLSLYICSSVLDDTFVVVYRTRLDICRGNWIPPI